MRISKSSPKRKNFDLLSNSLNSLCKEIYRNQFGEFLCGYWDLKGYHNTHLFLIALFVTAYFWSAILRLRSCGAELYRGAVFSLLFIGCYEVEQETGSKFGPHNMLNPFSSATSKCPVQQPIENWQLKYVFKTIFSLFFLIGGWRGNERSCRSASREMFPTFFGMVGAQTCPTTAQTPHTPSTVQHHSCGAISSIALNLLLFRSSRRQEGDSSPTNSPPRSLIATT